MFQAILIDEPLRASNIRRRRRIYSSDSLDNERPTEQIRSGEQQQAAEIISPSTNNLRCKNGHKWSAQPSEARTSRTQSRNIVHIVQGPKNEVKNAMTALEQFKMFISDAMVSIIVLHTNVKIATKRENYAAKTATVSDTCAEGIYALIGLLLLAARKKDNHLTAAELFDPSESGTKYISVMSKDRFDFLLNCLRFDDKSTREERKAIDKFAPIREIWEMLIAVCRDSYKPGSYVTVDEQLLGFRGRCPFRMYIPSKPDKYGIKTVVLCDSKTNYMIDAIPYMGKGTNTNGEPLASFFVKQLTESIRGSYRNVTMDNWFTSVPLAKELMQDQMCHNMSCNRKTQRWPLCYFYGMLNMSMVNSFVIHVHNNMNNQQRPLKRRAFIKEVSDKMIEPWLRRRRETPTLRRCLKRNIDAILGDTLPDAPVNPENQSRKLCNFCCYKKKRVTRFICTSCKRYMCMEHRGSLCLECSD